MNVAFISPSISRTAGGIFEIERRLAQSLSALPETQVSVFGLRDEHTAEDLPSWQPLLPQAFPVSGPRAFGYSAPLKEAFLGQSADVTHLHALWMFTSVVIRRWSDKHRRPYVVTPNGMLEPWALRNSAWKKRLAAMLYERKVLNGAACLQANTEKEAADFRAYGLKNPIAIIPNGIDLPTEAASREQGAGSRQPFSILDLQSSQRKVLLYLGRIHPKKGLVNLLKAWACVSKERGARSGEQGWVLAIAGWDQGGHETELKALAAELGLSFADARKQGVGNKGQGEGSTLHASRSVLFLGPQFGAEKAACYAGSDAFILPSYSEGLPMAVLEAWAYSKPVLMTPECNLPEGFEANAAIRIEQGAGSGEQGVESREQGAAGIEQGLRKLLQASGSDLQALGANGRRLVAEKFTWPKIASEMHSVYRWVREGGSPPGCVQLK